MALVDNSTMSQGSHMSVSVPNSKATPLAAVLAAVCPRPSATEMGQRMHAARSPTVVEDGSLAATVHRHRCGRLRCQAPLPSHQHRPRHPCRCRRRRQHQFLPACRRRSAMPVRSAAPRQMVVVATSRAAVATELVWRGGTSLAPLQGGAFARPWGVVTAAASCLMAAARSWLVDVASPT